MSANEIANHLEAACWLRFGPEGALLAPQFRSQNGFLNTIGVFDPSDPMVAPVCFVQLDRMYSRRETSINAFLPLILDVATVPPAGPAVVAYPADVPNLPPVIQPIRSGLVYGAETIPVDTDAAAEYLDKFDGFMVFPYTFGGDGVEATFADVCIQLFRIPKGDYSNVTYREIVGVGP